jgi:hypothetical protein
MDCCPALAATPNLDFLPSSLAGFGRQAGPRKVIAMRTFAITLKLLALVFPVVAALHLVLGLNAEALLGATVAKEVVEEPSLSSQNRFYGVAFSLYGAVLYLCATDLPRFEPVLKAALVVFFIAGAARLVPWVAIGAPAPMVVALMASELLLPPALWLWYVKLRELP